MHDEVCLISRLQLHAHGLRKHVRIFQDAFLFPITSMMVTHAQWQLRHRLARSLINTHACIVLLQSCVVAMVMIVLFVLRTDMYTWLQYFMVMRKVPPHNIKLMLTRTINSTVFMQRFATF